MSDPAPHTPAPPRAVPQRTLLGYGQLALPLAIADLPLDIYLTTFYGTDLGVPLAAMAWVILIARLSDVVTDPLIGILSDRSGNWSWGRRKSWVLLGIPIKMLGIYAIFFAEPETTDATYMLVWLIVLYLGWTMISIPYGAWGAELSGQYHERSRITGYRTGFGMLGVFIAAIAPVIVGGGAGTPEGLTPVMQAIGWGSMILFPLSALAIFWLVPEPPVRSISGGLTWWQGLKIASRNGPFLRILIAGSIGRTGAAINGTVVLWFFVHALSLGPAAGLPLFCYLIAAVLGVPIWVTIAKAWNKHRTLVVATAIGIAFFGLLFFVPQGALIPACAILFLAGLSGSAAPILGASIAADVIDLDELHAGSSRAGLLIAFWGMGQKAGAAFGYFIALMILSSFGFDATSTTNDATALMGLTLTYIVVPWFFYAASIVLLWNFPLTPERQAEIRAMVEARAAHGAAEAVPGVVTPLGGPLPLPEADTSEDGPRNHR
ncbi:MAG: MFS transporter [Alphaproteobacteria bacterium]|nr:MFS transporter [Alphaproteobacteria bacterium]